MSLGYCFYNIDWQDMVNRRLPLYSQRLSFFRMVSKVLSMELNDTEIGHTLSDGAFIFEAFVLWSHDFNDPPVG